MSTVCSVWHYVVQGAFGVGLIVLLIALKTASFHVCCCHCCRDSYIIATVIGSMIMIGGKSAVKLTFQSQSTNSKANQVAWSKRLNCLFRTMYNGFHRQAWSKNGFSPAGATSCPNKREISRLSGRKCGNTALKTVKISNFGQKFVPQKRLICNIFTKFSVFVRVYR